MICGGTELAAAPVHDAAPDEPWAKPTPSSRSKSSGATGAADEHKDRASKSVMVVAAVAVIGVGAFGFTVVTHDRSEPVSVELAGAPGTGNPGGSDAPADALAFADEAEDEVPEALAFEDIIEVYSDETCPDETGAERCLVPDDWERRADATDTWSTSFPPGATAQMSVGERSTITIDEAQVGSTHWRLASIVYSPSDLPAWATADGADVLATVTDDIVRDMVRAVLDDLGVVRTRHGYPRWTLYGTTVVEVRAGTDIGDLRMIILPAPGGLTALVSVSSPGPGDGIPGFDAAMRSIERVN